MFSFISWLSFNYYKILAVPTPPSNSVIMPALVENNRSVSATPVVPRYIKIEPSWADKFSLNFNFAQLHFARIPRK